MTVPYGLRGHKAIPGSEEKNDQVSEATKGWDVESSVPRRVDPARGDAEGKESALVDRCFSKRPSVENNQVLGRKIVGAPRG